MPIFQALSMFAGMMCLPALVGVFAIWLATRSAHWAVGLSILFLTALPWTFVEAPDLFWVVWIGSAVCFLTVRTLQPPNATTTQFGRMSVFDLMLIVAFIAITLGTILRADSLTVTELGWLSAVGAAFGCWMASGWYLANGEGKWWKRLALILLPCGLLAYAGTLAHWPASAPNGVIGGFSVMGSMIFGQLVPVNMMLVGIVSHVTGCAKRMNEPLHCQTLYQRIQKNIRRYLGMPFTIAIAILAVTGAGRCWLALYQGNQKTLAHFPARNQQDQPNGYADFVAANQLLHQIPELNGDNYLQSGAVLRRVLDKHRKVFAMIETGLGREVQTCVGSDQGYTNVRKLTLIKTAHLIKSQQERFEKKFDEAIETSLNTALVAQSLSREGNALSLLEGLSMEQACYPAIQIALPDASLATLEITISRLKEIDRQATSPHQATKNELAWAWNSENWYGKLFITYFQLLVPDNAFLQYLYLQTRLVEFQTNRRLLIIATALELHRKTHRVYPDRLADLVTTGLLEEQILVDPCTEELQLIYRNLGDDYELYSRGVDRIDDDGMITRNANGDCPDINLKAAAKQMFAEEATSP